MNPEPQVPAEPQLTVITETGNEAIDPEADYLADLLERAEHALRQDRLLMPEEGSAFGYYRDVLRLDPNNPIAHSGMQRITERYFALAESHWRAGNTAEAERMLDRAQQVSASPAQVARLKAGWPAPRRPNNSFGLAPGALSAKDDAIRARLKDIAQRARELDSRLLIVARNDAEGRWIYQHMREAVEGYRLRGNIEMGREPRIVLIDMEE